jgi:ATP-dependent RNA circularization protein (DNA/RNA ligase family)
MKKYFPTVLYKKSGNKEYTCTVQNAEDKEKLKDFIDNYDVNFEQVPIDFKKACEIVESVNKEEKEVIVEKQDEKTYNIEKGLSEMTWHELRAHAKRLESDSGVKIITQKAKREDILKNIKDLNDGNNSRSSN